MRQLLLSAAILALSLTAARADVVLDTKLSGTGDNVVFDQLGVNSAIGSFNGQHTGFVFFNDLSLNPNFVGAANGNDIKIANTSNLQYSVFADLAQTTQLFTSTDVFSLKGSGDVTAFVTAIDAQGNVEPLKVFDLGLIGNSQSGFTFTAINGELIKSMRLFDTGGEITDFEHYRIDVGQTAAVPGPIVGAGLPGLMAMALGLVVLARRRRNQAMA
jgi:hypothetical protein